MGSNGPESAVVICVARAGPRVGGGRVCGSEGREIAGATSTACDGAPRFETLLLTRPLFAALSWHPIPRGAKAGRDALEHSRGLSAVRG